MYRLINNHTWKLYDNFEHKFVYIRVLKKHMFEVCSQEQLMRMSIPIYEGFFRDNPSDKYIYVVQMPYWRYKRPLYAIRKDVFDKLFIKEEEKI